MYEPDRAAPGPSEVPDNEFAFISVRADAEATLLGYIGARYVRPRSRWANAFGLAQWADSVIAFLINLPLIVIWFVSIVSAVILLRVLRFFGRKFGPKTSWRLPWGLFPS